MVCKKRNHMKKSFISKGTIVFVLLSACLLCLNAAAADKKAILLVAFGTTVTEAQKSYSNIEKIIKSENKDIPVYWAYTSNKVREILRKKGTETMSVPEALAKIRADGVTSLAVQSLHMVPGLEYHKKILFNVSDFQKGKDAFEKVAIGKPMLLSAASLEEFCNAMVSILPKDRKAGDAVLLMGHNNDKGSTDLFYIAAGLSLNKKDPNIYLATVEGSPNFEAAVAEMKKNKNKKVFLMPMMIVAGDHANNDLAGDEDTSWKKQLEKDTFTCVPVLKGLGEYDVFAKIYAARLKIAMDELAQK